jgi:hypothetical protein
VSGKVHLCAAPGCFAPVSAHRLLCGAHWAGLPVDVQAKIRFHLIAHNPDSARVVLRAHFTDERHIA